MRAATTLLPPLPSRVEYGEEEVPDSLRCNTTCWPTGRPPNSMPYSPSGHVRAWASRTWRSAARPMPAVSTRAQDAGGRTRSRPALLGLTDDARQLRGHQRRQPVAPQARFPGFLYHPWDWIPDVDQGGVIMIALQRMLLQWDGDRILLLPAWPKDWDVSFKLHVPQRTTVECVYRGGEVEMLKVTPESRRKDVEVTTSAAATLPATTR